MSENIKYLIVTSGRSGSTLLCSILADAGADFGLTTASSWDPTGGDFEHSAMWRAAKRYHDAFRISPDRPNWPKKWLWDTVRWSAKRQLRRALGKARFFKAIHLDLVAQPAFKLGFQPRVIISYRPFGDQLLSLAGMFTERPVSAHAAEYMRTYQNALLWLNLFGGCVVSYDEMTDLNDTGWIGALAMTTGLAAEDLAESRGRRLLPRIGPRDCGCSAYGTATAVLEQSLQSLCGVVVPPSHVAIRAWHSRHGPVATKENWPEFDHVGQRGRPA